MSKFEAEQGLQNISRKSKIEVVIIRPPLVYGAGVKGNFKFLLNLVKFKFPLPLGGIMNKRSLVYVGNLVSLIELVIEHPHAAGKIFLVSDGEDISTSELINIIFEKSGNKIRLFKFPSSLMKLFLTLIGKGNIFNRLYDNLQVDIGKTQEKLGWEVPYSVEEGIIDAIEGHHHIKQTQI